MHKFTKRLLVAILVLSFSLCNITNVWAAAASISIKVNPVTIKINTKAAKIDVFEYKGNFFVQPQDLCNTLGLSYTYTAKTKLVAISSTAPAKPVTPAPPRFASVKPSTVKKISVQANTLTIKIDGKAQKLENYIYNKSIYLPIKSLSTLLKRDYSYDAAKKLVTINDKKPATPVITPSTAETTDKDITITITNWGNAKVMEYQIDDGKWQKYTTPFTMSKNGTIHARGKNAAGIESDIAELKITNIRKQLTKQEVSALNYTVVKIIEYNINNDEIGSGSGIIISPGNRVVTNYHVVDMTTDLEIKTTATKTYKVKSVLAYSEEKDLAILQLDTAEMLPYAKLGDSSKVALGEDMVAIGYPLGLQNTVSFGNISSISPELSRKGYTDFLITNPISSGSSGGALFNMYGEVVGVTYATQTNGQNMNYSIPINDLSPLLSSSSTKTVLEVCMEENIPLSYENFEGYLDGCYSYYEVNEEEMAYYFTLVDEYKDNPNKLDIALCQNELLYNYIRETVQKGKKAEVETWLKDILNEVKFFYKGKDCSIELCQFEVFDSMPSGYASNEIKSVNGKYLVYRSVVVCEYTSSTDTFTFSWTL